MQYNFTTHATSLNIVIKHVLAKDSFYVLKPVIPLSQWFVMYSASLISLHFSSNAITVAIFGLSYLHLEKTAFAGLPLRKNSLSNNLKHN